MEFLSEKDVLHRAILANPDDLVARGLYADELMVSGDPEQNERGELINQMLRCDWFYITIEAAYKSDRPCEPSIFYHYGHPFAGNRALFEPYKSHLRKLVAEICELVGNGNEICKAVIRNGFVTEVEVGNKGWNIDFTGKLFRKHPIKKVVRAGLEPALNEYTGLYLWQYATFSQFFSDYRLIHHPSEICDLIFSELKNLLQNPCRSRYNNPDEAFQDFDQAVIQAARKLAGLPKWEAK